MELLLVVVIISVLLVVATPFITGAMQANRLTMVGSTLAFKLSLAQQSAVTQKKPVEVRFYSYAHQGVTAGRAYQIFVRKTDDADGGGLVAMENAELFGDGEVVMAAGALSPVFTAAGAAVTEGPFATKAGGATYQRLIFYPDGSTNLTASLRDCFLTLVIEGSPATAAAAPPNYYTIQIDPVTGRARSYRP